MNKDEALKMAIEALEDMATVHANLEPIINACKEALAQQAQEPVATIVFFSNGNYMILSRDLAIDKFLSKEQRKNHEEVLLYPHPAQPWQGLTADELEDIKDNSKEGWYQLVRNVEQALRERNT